MNEDKKLTVLAAKAIGMEHPGGDHSIHDDGRLWDCQSLCWWNPLHDDGDALRLAVKLRITIEQDLLDTRVFAYVLIGSRRANLVAVSGKVTQEEATRRAIVRAAAEIGKAMP